MEHTSLVRRWIGLHAGPQQLSALHYAADGSVGERRKTSTAAIVNGSSSLADTIREMCGDWLTVASGSALIGAGLSHLLPVDLAPAPIQVPLDLGALASLAVQVNVLAAHPFYVFPDVEQNGILPERITSHTAALLGVRASTDEPDLLVGLLGEQHQWVRFDRQRIRRFVSFITPSLQRLLSTEPSTPDEVEDDTDWHSGAFDFGLAVARGEDRQAGMLATLGSPQALVRSGQLASAELGSFRRGLLIGHELLGLKRMEPDSLPQCPVILVGTEDACARYARALQLYGYEHVERARHAAERGLWQLAQAIDNHTPAIPE